MDAQGSVTGSGLTGTGTGSQVTASAATGNVDVSNVSAGTVALAAAGTVTGDNLDVGSTLQLSGTRISGSVFGGAQVVGGSITGPGGAPADNVQLSLSTPSGFAFSAFSSDYATVTIPSGWLSVGTVTIGDRATFTTPATSVLVDQLDETEQPYDVQLYTGGAQFAFSTAGNKVVTDAYVVYRDPDHEALAPAGEDRGGTEQAADAVDRTEYDPALVKPLAGAAGQEASGRGSLISFSGFPVSVSDEEEGE
jgi:hypothetical protein